MAEEDAVINISAQEDKGFKRVFHRLCDFSQKEKIRKEIHALQARVEALSTAPQSKQAKIAAHDANVKVQQSNLNEEIQALEQEIARLENNPDKKIKVVDVWEHLQFLGKKCLTQGGDGYCLGNRRKSGQHDRLIRPDKNGSQTQGALRGGHARDRDTGRRDRILGVLGSRGEDPAQHLRAILRWAGSARQDRTEDQAIEIAPGRMNCKEYLLRGRTRSCGAGMETARQGPHQA